MFRQKIAPGLLIGALTMCAQTALFAADTNQVSAGVDAVSAASTNAVEEVVEQANDATKSTIDEAEEATETTETTETVNDAVEAAETLTDEADETSKQPAATETLTTQDSETTTSKAEEPAHDAATVMPPLPIMEIPDDETLQNVFYAFRERFPSLPLDDISVGPYPGWFEIISDSRLVYVTEDVSLLFQGSIVDLNSGIDLSEARMAGLHMGLINGIGEENMLVYTAEPASDRSITVFTDINCGYCQLLHSQIDVLLDNGVNVRYLMFPRAGLESESRAALESVWCADNPQAAMTAAKLGEPVTRAECGAPVESHYEVAGKVGLRGTPLIYLDNGSALPGYREASVIIEMIHSTEPMTE